MFPWFSVARPPWAAVLASAQGSAQLSESMLMTIPIRICVIMREHMSVQVCKPVSANVDTHVNIPAGPHVHYTPVVARVQAQAAVLQRLHATGVSTDLCIPCVQT